MMYWTALVAGLGCGSVAIGALIWSIAMPARRIWPPRRYTRGAAALVWGLTLGLFGAAAVLGVVGWNDGGYPEWARWGVGLPLFVLSNLVVWPAAAGFGYDRVSGARGELQTGGIYRWSRHPQYMADVAMLAGWALWSAAPAVLPVAAVGIAALLLAPWAEEPWLERIHGADYRRYRARVRMYL